MKYNNWQPSKGRPEIVCEECGSNAVVLGDFFYQDDSVTHRKVECVACGEEGKAIYEKHGPNAWIEGDEQFRVTYVESESSGRNPF